MSSNFVHLRVHTEYSLLDSVLRIPSLMSGCAELGLPAVALTDESNLFAMVKFYRGALAAGVKPLVGADLWVCAEDSAGEPGLLPVICQNRQGYLNLSALITKSYAQGQNAGRPLVSENWLTPESTAGLIALSGGPAGFGGQAIRAGVFDRARESFARWAERFPDRYYVEVQRLGRPGEQAACQATVEIASDLGLPLVATNDVRFLREADFEAHEARVCIYQGRTLNDANRPRDYTAEQYLKSPEQMAALFGDLPEALANTVEIAKRCNLDVELGTSFLPEFPVAQETSIAETLIEGAQLGLSNRLKIAQHAEEAEYQERLERELDVVLRMGFEGYFLIVADFIAWAREQKIPVGPGRGSGAGSLVAYALGITDLDPLEHDLLFERFLNPERVSMPDFDIDFCIEGRDRVIEYVTQKYGRDKVSQIITYGSMAARAVVRDVGRVLGLPYGFVDRIAKLIPFEIGMTLDKALQQDEELRNTYQSDDEVRTLIDLAKPLEGLARNAGKHAGGVVISPAPLTEFTPLYCESDGAGFVTQLDKDDVESIGLVKFDFLGLKTLTVINKALANVNKLKKPGDPPLLVEDIPQSDPPTYELLKSCNTTAVFQLESRGMRDLIKRLQPDHFDDIVALVALFRPGPLQSGMVDDFIDRKHGRNATPIDYLHPSLESILKPTYGVILYQEQVMQIAQILAGYSLGEADLLRRAMGKKKPEEMAKQRSVFLTGCAANQIDESKANYIFDLMEKFAGYGFNKSHSAAYALVAYQTAYLKAHYPEAFMAAVMSADLDHTDKLTVLKDDCQKNDIEVHRPDVNDSGHEFAVGKSGGIRYGLGALKGVGRSVVEAIIESRDEGGPFASLADFCSRADFQRLNRRALEALVKAGAMDGLGANRASLLAVIPDAVRAAERASHARETGQNDLFSLGSDEPTVELEVPTLRDCTSRERLVGERESLGLYLSGHPFDEYREHCRFFTDGSLGNLAQAPMPTGNRFSAPRRTAVVAGMVTDIRRRGNRVTFNLDDASARMEVTLFEDVYNQFRHLLAKDEVLVVEGSLRYDDFIDGWRITGQSVRTVDSAIESHARRLVIRWGLSSVDQDFVQGLKQTLKPFTNGECDVCIQYSGHDASATVTLGDQWMVKPTRELRDRLTEMLGEDSVILHYPRNAAISA